MTMYKRNRVDTRNISSRKKGVKFMISLMYYVDFAFLRRV